MIPKRAKKKKRARIRLKHPFSIEREYQRKLRALVAGYREVFKRFEPRLKSVWEDMNFHRPAAARQDAWPDDLKQLISDITIEMGRVYTPDEIEEIADSISESVSDFSRESIERELSRVLGIDVFSTEPWLKEELGAFSARNVDLIGSIEDRARGRMLSTIQEGFASGARWEEISKDVSGDFDVSESDGDRIARDQVSKLNGQLNMLRQTDLGITSYIWRTSLDERVREMHAKLEGSEFDWNDPPVTNPQGDKNIPGGDYNCRCWAEAILPE